MNYIDKIENITYKIFIYVLELEDGFYYVGKSQKPDKLLNQHLTGGRKGAEWTKLHKPIKRISCESYWVSSEEEEIFLESQTTITLMIEKGWNKVRGGNWTYISDIETLKKLHSHGFFKEIDIESANFSPEKINIYVLKLENNKYFVSSTHNLKRALKNHKKGHRCKWTKNHPPIECIYIEELILKDGMSSLESVDKLVIQYIRLYGWENVRGGSFTYIDLERHLKSLKIANPNLF